MTVHIVAEGDFDRLLVEKLIAGDRELSLVPHRVISAGGASSAVSLARTFAGPHGVPTALLADADTWEPDQVETNRGLLRGLMGLAAPSTLWTLVLFVPVLEIVFFERPEILRRYSPKPLPRKPADPRSELERVARAAGFPDLRGLIHGIRRQELQPLWGLAPFQELRDFLTRGDWQADVPATR